MSWKKDSSIQANIDPKLKSKLIERAKLENKAPRVYIAELIEYALLYEKLIDALVVLRMNRPNK